MAISSVSHSNHTRMISNDSSQATSKAASKEQRNKLGNELFKLNEQIKKIENSVIQLNFKIKSANEGIKKDTSMLSTVESISAKHGKDSTVRLKGDVLKYGQASGFLGKLFHGGRYQQERSAAAEKFNLQSRDVTVSDARLALNEKIESGNKKVDSYQADIQNYKAQLSKLNAQYNTVDTAHRTIAKNEANARQTDDKISQQKKMFCSIYQTDVGCAALNAMARRQNGYSVPMPSLSSSAVIREYEKVHGNDVFLKGNAELKSDIEINSKRLSTLLEVATKAWYKPTTETITTHRGQGMTDAGFRNLVEQFKEDRNTVYKLGQFFSTSTDSDVANGFASASEDAVQVLFKVKGNSSSHIFVGGGLTFGGQENERLYSPLAHFKVTGVSKPDSNGMYHVSLQEVSQTAGAKRLPY